MNEHLIIMRHINQVKILFFLTLCFLSVKTFGNLEHQLKALSPPDTCIRKTPVWFNNAKLGIFIHWGLYSVPAWATPTTTPDKVTDWKAFYRSNPYAEWYLNSMRIDGSPTQQYHAKTYGKDFNYYAFKDSLITQSAKWNADSWVELFAQIGARYVVFTTKHHDGFTMYPSKIENPCMRSAQISSPRDFVGELCRSARKYGLKFGAYYSGGLDWTFNQAPVTNLWPDLFDAMPKSQEYDNYADAHLYEIIRNYTPDILWNDVNYPNNGNLPGIVSELFRLNPQAVVNDRWQQLLELADFTTPEYQVMDSIVAKKWETCRGLGYSFGYNQVEGDLQLLSSNELISLLIDIVSKNGNLLLNVGPKADGSIPENQLKRLRDLGNWLKINGEGIFDTKPWIVPNQILSNGDKIFFTRKNDNLYIFLRNPPKDGIISVPNLRINSDSEARIAGATNEKLQITRTGHTLSVQLPQTPDFMLPVMISVSHIKINNHIK